MPADPPVSALNDHEIAAVRQNLNLLKAQLQTGRIDASFMIRQLDKLGDLLTRLEGERRQFKRHERFEALFNISRSIGSSLDLQTVLTQVMDAIIQLTGAERGFLMLRDHPDEAPLVKAARNLDQQTLSSDQFHYSRTVVNHVLTTGESILTTNASEDPRFAGQSSIVIQRIHSIMATPLLVAGQVSGVIYVDNSLLTGQLFEEDDIRAMSAFAAQAAVAITNAQVFRQTDAQLARHVEELNQLRAIDQQLGATLDVERVLQVTVDAACRLVDAPRAHLAMAEEGQLITLAHHGFRRDETIPTLLERHFPAARTVFETSSPQSTWDPDSGRGVLIVPIGRESRAFGVLVLMRPRPFSPENIETVSLLLSRASVAIDNARLYARVQAADRAKTEFVGIVAHDLKVPMTSIIGYSELTLMDGDLQPHQVEFLERINDTVRRMERLVSDLADISRIESGLFLMEPTRVTVGEIMQGLRENIATEVHRRGHTYIESIEADLPPMYVDYYRLLQVLTNLASNAYKYTPNGGTIRVIVERGRLQNEDRVTFTVADNGIGMTAEQVSKLGTKFYRVNNDYTRSQPGTGLGYAITASIVEQMGSPITVVSVPDQGSSFSFSVAVVDNR